MAKSLCASVKGLEIVDRARRRRGWSKTCTARWWQEAHTSRSTLRRFWQRERIQEDIFIAICQAVGIRHWEQIVDSEILDQQDADPLYEDNKGIPEPAPPDGWVTPDLDRFYGRQLELEQLEEWVVARCQLITILGMAGIGKTALALAFADRIQESFECVIWRSLQPTPLPLQLLDGLLQVLSTRQTIYVANDLQTGMTQLVKLLQQKRCLIILDGWDHLYREHAEPKDADTGQYRSGDQDYSTLLLGLSQTPHQSCILITSREQPSEIESKIHPYQSAQSLFLQGLQRSEALELLRSQGLSLRETELSTLIRLYSSNPLALKLVTPMIQKWGSDRLHTLLDQNLPVVSDPLRCILQQHLDELSGLERDIAYWLVIWQEPISLHRLRTHLLRQLTPLAILEGLTALEHKSLLVKQFSADAILFTLQPLFMQLLLEELVEQAFQEICQVLDSGDISSFDVIRTHCLLRPGTDDIAGDLILSWLGDKVESRLGSDSPTMQVLSCLPSRLQDQSPLRVGYANCNLLALVKRFGWD